MTIFVTPPFFADDQEKGKAKERKMPNNKKKHSRAAQLAPQPQPTAVISDYDTDTAYNTESQVLPVTAPPPNRSPAQLNMLVLRRWYPAITSILAIAPFAVLYSFSPDSQSWDKCDTQGSLFVCELSPLPGSVVPRYKVIILNRRNPKNFELDLVSTEDIEVTEEFVIIPYVDAETGEAHIYGIWVFRDEEQGQGDVRSYIANVILKCAGLAERGSVEPATESYTQEENDENGHYDDRGYGLDGIGNQLHEENVSQQPQTMMGQSIDLATLFGKPVQQQGQWKPHQNPGHQYHDESQRFAPTADTAFFRDTNSPATSSGYASQVPPPAAQQDALLNLFKNAKKG